MTVGSRLARCRLTINGSTVNLGGLRWTSQKMRQFGVHKMGTMSGRICDLDSAPVLGEIPLWKDSADSAYMNSTDSAHTCNSDAFFSVLIA